MDQGYGIKCEPEPPFQLDYYRPLSSESEQSPEGTLDMDLTGFLDMDDTALSGKSRRERERVQLQFNGLARRPGVSENG